jgi:hypothetical protein
LVELTELREAPYPPAGGGELSNSDGSYCIKNIPPGKYLLTAEKTDFDRWTRVMGLYPGVSKHADATPIELKAGSALTLTLFKLEKERLYDVRIKVITSDGSPLPFRQLGVAVKSPDRDPLAYNQHHHVGRDGSYSFGYIPAGRYVVTSYTTPDSDEANPGDHAFNWTNDNREIEVTGPTAVVLKIVPKR